MAANSIADPTAETVRTLPFADAVIEAIGEAMERDPKVLAMGVSVDDPLPTRGSNGLVERFGKSRVLGTPLSEDGMTGVAIGMAMAGFRPVQIHGRLDFTMLAMNQLVNVAAKVRGMYAGQAGGVPITVRATIGRSWGQGAQHSQGLQSLFAHVPGLRVVMPSTPADAKGALSWALSGSRDPVIFIDHRMLHKVTGPVRDSFTAGAANCAPADGWRKPVDGGDITIVALSYMVVEARRAVDILQKLGIAASLFDPLWIRPLPCLPAVAEDVRHSSRLLVVDCGWKSYGIGAELIAGVAERGVTLSKVSRLGFAETVCPTAKSLEELYYPNADTIAAKAYEMVTGESMPARDSNGTAPEISTFRGPF